MHMLYCVCMCAYVRGRIDLGVELFMKNAHTPLCMHVCMWGDRPESEIAHAEYTCFIVCVCVWGVGENRPGSGIARQIAHAPF